MIAKIKQVVVLMSVCIVQLDEDEDVYDVVDEEKYAQIVEERRNAGDFVVDDGK
jgi:hypothetical protein